MRALRVTHRQLQWWDERNVIAPRREKHARMYTEREAVLVGVVQHLRACCLSLQAIRKFLRRLERAIDNVACRYVVVIPPGRLFSEWDPAPVVRLLTQARAFAVVVDVVEISDRLREKCSA